MKDLFSLQASDYAVFRPAYPKYLFDFILSKVQEKKCAWDCGTGNGQVAAALADDFTTVFATDISEKQIQNAVRKRNIVYSIQPAEKTDFSASIFDLIIVAQAIHWFNFNAFYTEVKRTIKPHGLLAVMGYGLLQTEGRVSDIINHFYSQEIGPYWDKERKFIDESYKSIPFPFPELETPVFSMRYMWSINQLTGYLGTWSSVQYYKNRHKKDPVDLIYGKLVATWGSEPVKEFTFPIFLRVGLNK